MSSEPLYTKRMRPSVYELLPPRSSCGARSSSSTLAPSSAADIAAHNAALPPPTTITSYFCSCLSIRAPAGSDPGLVGLGSDPGLISGGGENHLRPLLADRKRRHVR